MLLRLSLTGQGAICGLLWKGTPDRTTVGPSQLKVPDNRPYLRKSKNCRWTPLRKRGDMSCTSATASKTATGRCTTADSARKQRYNGLLNSCLSLSAPSGNHSSTPHTSEELDSALLVRLSRPKQCNTK